MLFYVNGLSVDIIDTANLHDVKIFKRLKADRSSLQTVRLGFTSYNSCPVLVSTPYFFLVHLPTRNPPPQTTTTSTKKKKKAQEKNAVIHFFYLCSATWGHGQSARLLSLAAQACSHVICVPLLIDGVHRSGGRVGAPSSRTPP